MKRIFAILLSIVTVSAFAANQPTFSIKESTGKGVAMTAPGYCEIEVANHSAQPAVVDIYYDDAAGYRNNYVQPGFSLFVNLNYSGYCHNRSYLVVSSPTNYLLYAGYTAVYDVVDVYNRLQGKAEAKLIKKS